MTFAKNTNHLVPGQATDKEHTFHPKKVSRLVRPIASLLIMVFGLVMFLALAGCTDQKVTPFKASASSAPKSDAAMVPSTEVLGVVPAGPTVDAPATTSPAKSDVSRAQQSNAMPLPGQANDHSVLKPVPPPKPVAAKPVAP